MSKGNSTRPCSNYDAARDTEGLVRVTADTMDKMNTYGHDVIDSYS